MARYYTESGYTRGGIDVTEAVNLVFKGLLLSPIFMLCIFVTIAMLKHMIFGGIPTMNQPSEQQREQIQQRDAEIDPNTVWGGTPKPTELPAPAPKQNTEVPFVIYDGPQELPKYEQPVPAAGWQTEILEDPFQ